ncbi:MAG: hypothetical protein KAG66_00590 [Methylococcales bacterium]|nr:hypothetical protein [Methylococcales bacterium]
MLKNANYHIVENNHFRMLIRDLGPWDEHKTITNDAEAVVDDLKIWLGDRRLEYIDSGGVRTEMLVHKGHFKGFRDIDNSQD